MSTGTAAGTEAAAERRGLLVAFAAFGAFWGAWSATLPDIRAQAGVTDGELGLALAAVAVAAVPAMPLAGRLIDRHGARRLLPPALLLFAIACVLPAFAGGLLPLALGLLALGASTGGLDVFLNATTATWERLEGRRLMAGAHGCFSLGVLVAGIGAGIARDQGVGPLGVLGASMLVILGAAAAQPAYRDADQAPRPSSSSPAVRPRLAPVLLVLGLLIGGSFLVEDAVQSWSALHLERSLGAPAWIGGLGVGLFAGAMALGRFAVQWLARPGTDALVVGGGGVTLTAGVLVLALAPTAPMALVGAGVAGAGVSVLSPTMFSAVGARSAPGRAGAELALVTTLGYVGFVAGPPLIGLLSAATTLPTALTLLAVVPATVALVGPYVLRRPGRPKLV